MLAIQANMDTDPCSVIFDTGSAYNIMLTERAKKLHMRLKNEDTLRIISADEKEQTIRYSSITNIKFAGSYIQYKIEFK